MLGPGTPDGVRERLDDANALVELCCGDNLLDLCWGADAGLDRGPEYAECCFQLDRWDAGVPQWAADQMAGLRES